MTMRNNGYKSKGLVFAFQSEYKTRIFTKASVDVDGCVHQK